MEQAINLFTKGLQCDTHPMVQGNDTLTDCLNGTLITMNGDEVILQNDMGNRRVDNAFLPAGFEPIGIKEYGGIIYIAAYNPITDQSQIGCFPSPQRRYTNNLYDDENIPILELDLNSNSDIFKRIKFGKANLTDYIYSMLNDTYLIKLINKPLCPGDKFLTTINKKLPEYEHEDIWECNLYLSNWDLKDELPRRKNKLYTLSYGILNSQNLFVDITKYLIRWDSNGDIIKSSNNSEIDFNSGYFLRTGNFTFDTEVQGTSDDLELEQNRLQLEMNTYSGKLVGIPHIKIKLNHPESFGYSYRGKKITVNDNDGIELSITGTIIYNCSIDDEEIIDTAKDIFMLFRTFPNQVSSPISYPILLIPESNTSLISSYDEKTKLFTSSVTKVYEIQMNNNNNTNSNNNIFSGYLGVPVSSLNNYFIVGNLTLNISIDTSLFGSNMLLLDTWGFKQEDGSLYIRYSINDYLYEYDTITSLKLKFTDLTQNNLSFEIIISDNYLGVLDFKIEDNNLQNRHIYNVDFIYTTQEFPEERTIRNADETSLNLWLLNTKLLNECYDKSGNKLYIRNFCNRDEREQQIYDEITKIRYVIDPGNGILLGITTTSKYNDTDFYTTDIDKTFEVYVENTITGTLSLNNSVTIEHIEDYPIDLNLPTINSVNLNNESYSKDIILDIRGQNIINNLTTNDSRLEKLDNDRRSIDVELSKNNDDINIKVTYFDFFIGNPTRLEDVRLENCLCSMKEAVDDMFNNYCINNFTPVISIKPHLINNNYDCSIGLFNDLNQLRYVNENLWKYDPTYLNIVTNNLTENGWVDVKSTFLLNLNGYTNGLPDNCLMAYGYVDDTIDMTADGAMQNTGDPKPSKIVFYSDLNSNTNLDISNNNVKQTFIFFKDKNTRNIIKTLNNYIINESTDDLGIKEILYQLFDCKNKGIFYKLNVKKYYTVYSAKDSGIYTTFSIKDFPISIDLNYELLHDNNYLDKFSSESLNKLVIKNIEIQIISSEEFRDRLSTKLILSNIDTYTGKQLSLNSDNDGKVFKRPSDAESEYTEDEKIITQKRYDRYYPTFKPLNRVDSDHNSIEKYFKNAYCYSEINWPIINTSLRKHLYLYSFLPNDFNIINADTYENS